MISGRPSEWPHLFDSAIRILSHFERAHGGMPVWSFGGGTALMLQIDHCKSHDIDLFLDPAVLLLARHLGSVATSDRSAGTQLRRACMDEIAGMKRRPVLLVLARKGVAFDVPA